MISEERIASLDLIVNTFGLIMTYKAYESIITDCTFHNLTGMLSTVGYLDSSDVIFKMTSLKTSIYDNIATDGAIVVFTSSEIYFENLTISNNQAFNSILWATVGGKTSIKTCIFKENYSATNGVINVGLSILDIENSTLIQN